MSIKPMAANHRDKIATMVCKTISLPSPLIMGLLLAGFKNHPGR
jgi:hypothetical protein